MKNKKSQAAMEWLMTYGWVILAAFIAIGVLAYFGVFSPGKYAYKEFEIYKEECKNETTIIACKLSHEEYEEVVCQKCNTFKSEEELLECINKRVECRGKFYERACVVLNEEVCKQIEITEEEFMRGFFNIPKEGDVNVELTHIWLDMNCECPFKEYLKEIDYIGTLSGDVCQEYKCKSNENKYYIKTKVKGGN